MELIKFCPVCEKHLPKDVVDFCFYCGFNLTRVNDKKKVTKCKYNFCGTKKELDLVPGPGTQMGPMPVIDLIIGILIGNLCYSIILNTFSLSNLWSGFFIFLLCLLFGFVAGALIYLGDFLIRNSFDNI